MPLYNIIREKLCRMLAITELDVIDESSLHAGHAGARPGGETHFKIRIVSKNFIGKSRLDRQRMVNLILAEELNHQIHALSMETLAPDEIKQ